MKKLTAVSLGLLMASGAFAAAPASPAPATEAAMVGIVTPNVASASHIFQYYTFAPDGGFLVCPGPVEHLSSGPVCGGKPNNAWLSLQRVVPVGAKYVGYRLLSDIRIEVFYK